MHAAESSVKAFPESKCFRLHAKLTIPPWEDKYLGVEELACQGEKSSLYCQR